MDCSVLYPFWITNPIQKQSYLVNEYTTYNKYICWFYFVEWIPQRIIQLISFILFSFLQTILLLYNSYITKILESFLFFLLFFWWNFGFGKLFEGFSQSLYDLINVVLCNQTILCINRVVYFLFLLFATLTA